MQAACGSKDGPLADNQQGDRPSDPPPQGASTKHLQELGRGLAQSLQEGTKAADVSLSAL